MDTLTIAQLAQFSGIKPHTIRIWEQRYGALSPKRTAGNTRTYDSLDLKRLLNIVSLIDSGYRISELGSMNDEGLNDLIKQQYHLEDNGNTLQFVPQLLSAGMAFDERSFQKSLSHCFSKFGTIRTYKDVIYPLINRVGLMWSADMLPPAQEHFMCNLIRQKLLVAIDALPLPPNTNKIWLLYLPEDEYHEIGLLFSHYVLKQKQQRVVYLGASVPLSTLALAIERIDPDFLLLFFVHYDFPENLNTYLKKTREIFKSGEIFASGNRKLVGQLSLDSQTQWLENVEDLERIV